MSPAPHSCQLESSDFEIENRKRLSDEASSNATSVQSTNQAGKANMTNESSRKSKEIGKYEKKVQVEGKSHTIGAPIKVNEPRKAHGINGQLSKKEDECVTYPRKQGSVTSWASIAGKSSSASNLSVVRNQANAGQLNHSMRSANLNDSRMTKKPGSFADAVTKGKSARDLVKNSVSVDITKDEKTKTREDETAPKAAANSQLSSRPTSNDAKNENNTANNDLSAPDPPPEAESNCQKLSTSHRITKTPSFPQGFHDVVEVLCSGETTPGKLLMHFLLFYGQHFESHSTAVDYSNTHRRDNRDANNGFSIRSSYLRRSTSGYYDPIKGIFTADPIVIYDPLEGAENNNVARSCYAWSSIRWVFAQSYQTLSSAAETKSSSKDGEKSRASNSSNREGPSYGHDESGHVVVDPSSPLLELLLSF